MNNLIDFLPESFLKQMRELLGDEYDAFVAGVGEPSKRGLRFNLLKHDSESFCDMGLGPLTPVPWCREGFMYLPEARPAKSILYNAGLFYIQEPSAMSPAAILRPQPGERVLDICAAPGGKSVQLAGYMRGGEKRFSSTGGVLVSNDISPSRSRALVKNLELAGVANAIVLTEKPNRLADRFPEYFDCILVDAPCSGEGMFRRDPDAVKAYTANKPESCAALQQEILRHAARMLKPGGRMVYSTCTFNTMENEGTVSAFLSAHEDFELLPIDHEGLGLSRGLGELSRAARIWPHMAPGEGHFIALMGKKGEDRAACRCEERGDEAIQQDLSFPNDTGLLRCARNDRLFSNDRLCSNYRLSSKDKLLNRNERLPEEFVAFCDENLCEPAFTDSNRIIHRHGNSLFLQPEHMDLSGLRVARSGWLLGECAKGRFVPSQAMAMGIAKHQARYAIDLPEPEALRYLRGESLPLPDGLASLPGKPWVLVCFSGLPLGWVRLVQGRLKNQLPTGWVVS